MRASARNNQTRPANEKPLKKKGLKESQATGKERREVWHACVLAPLHTPVLIARRRLRSIREGGAASAAEWRRRISMHAFCKARERIAHREPLFRARVQEEGVRPTTLPEPTAPLFPTTPSSMPFPAFTHFPLSSECPPREVGLPQVTSLRDYNRAVTKARNSANAMRAHARV